MKSRKVVTPVRTSGTPIPVEARGVSLPFPGGQRDTPDLQHVPLDGADRPAISVAVGLPVMADEAGLADDLPSLRWAIGRRLRLGGLGEPEAGYLRGRLLLLSLSASCPAKKIGSGRNRDKAVRAAAAPVAEEYGVAADAVIEDAALAIAVDAIAGSCGEQARAFLLGGTHRLSPKMIGQVSRCHPARQRHEIGEVMKGRRVFAKPADGVPVYDTWGYHEVVSRLARAEGNLCKQARIVSSHAPPADRQAEMKERAVAALAACREHARLMRLLLAAPSGSGSGAGALSEAPHWGKVAGGISSACGLVQKNVRDIPRMPSDMKATKAERIRIRGLLSGIRHHAGLIVRSLTERGAA